MRNAGDGDDTFATLYWKPIPGYDQEESTCDYDSDN